ncbi:MAG: ubiquitin-like protein Pup [Trueperella sp.]|nr:ubiquitin-like protein Pup [Trueperella sp.]
MREQQFQERSRRNSESSPTEQEIPGAKQDTDVTDLLADIDSILEENATNFVQGFVQKGGQ